MLLEFVFEVLVRIVTTRGVHAVCHILRRSSVGRAEKRWKLVRGFGWMGKPAAMRIAISNGVESEDAMVIIGIDD